MKKASSFRFFVGIAAALGLLALPLLAQTTAPASTTVPSRDYITARLAELRRIHTPEGIESLEEVTIGGTRQWVSIRGLNRANPVLLFIHGGPGTPMMPMTWAYQAPWEDFFTVVQWDQRGVGKNAVAADREVLKPTLTAERIIVDAEEMTAWVRKRLGKERIVVMGYSYGTQIAMALAQRRPEWLHAYVGVGQISSGIGEEYIYKRLLELAAHAKNDEALRELKAIAPYPGPNRTMADTLLVRKWARHFNGGWYGKPNFDLLFSLPDWAPEYTQADVDAQTKATQWFSRTVMGNARAQSAGAPRERAAASERNAFKVPVIVIMGRNDLHTPYEPAKAFFETIEAPHKRFITLERSAHVPMLEEPGLFLFTLIQELLPLTEGRAAFAPPKS
ncbi:MAG: alpha/beta hydrolase [Blastocatellia bacterium]|nr:alpha/beta hydrolase [Blastocatellia bacterium]